MSSVRITKENLIEHQFGADPEMFLEDKNTGKIVGSEKGIPEDGYTCPGGKIVRDGVQIELNPFPNKCREMIGYNLMHIFNKMKVGLEPTSYRLSLRQVVEVDRDELNALSPQARELGCQPSLNYYETSNGLGVNPKTYRKRSAGGHLHNGFQTYAHLMNNRLSLVPLMDICVGIPCVLLDREPLAAERRKVYGRAGEYRLQEWGIEYRTPSNFWLRAYPLQSLLTGLSRLAVNILNLDLTAKTKLQDELMSRIELHAVREAINTNDFNMALKEYLGLRDFIDNFVGAQNCGLYSEVLPDFDYFIKTVSISGLGHWFSEDFLTHWTTINPIGHTTSRVRERGSERFLSEIVRLERQNEEAKARNAKSEVRMPGAILEGSNAGVVPPAELD